jgi:(2Fe-2S) ferredoxin
MSTPIEIVAKKRSGAIGRVIGKGFLSSKRVYVGMATCEIAAGSQDVLDVLKEEIDKGLPGVYLSQKGCAGRCNLEPMVEIVETGKIPVKYCKVTPDMAREIAQRHLRNNEVITEWTIR